MIALKDRQRAAVLRRQLARAGDGALALGAEDGRGHVGSIGRPPSKLKALTVHQHWAWAIGAGLKGWENRTWPTSYRGPVAIIAGQSRKSLAASGALLASLGIEPPAEEELVFGAVVCVVELVDVVPISDFRFQTSDWKSPFATGPFCWRFENPRPLRRPIYCRGLLGLVDLPAGAAARIRRALAV